MSRLKVTQVRSVIHRPKDQKQTVRRLGLHRIRDSVVQDDRPEIRGMIAKVRHLVVVEEVADDGSRTTPRGEASKPRSSTRKATTRKTTTRKATTRKATTRKAATSKRTETQRGKRS